MLQPNDSRSPLAVLIDADNTSMSIVEGLLAAIEKLGVASVKRIYGDWTTPGLTQWKKVLLDQSIQPIQQFRYTVGKNATDSAMIIDAMDLLYTSRFGGFCLVSSDSDFTRLASRIRESGTKVYGFGEKKTPLPFVSACDQFVYTEVFLEPANATPTPLASDTPEMVLRRDQKLLNLLRTAIATASDEDGWTTLSAVGSYINRTSTDFDPRNYGFSKLSELISAIGLFKLERRGNQLQVQDGRKKNGT
ncbi:NYN domain-containing protein [Aureliella helgolandensis]|uniref:NYN domain protein n=1 Tax=Aureliella helgolandensis TaxID=2527968 RepID=A0A518G0U7_9BACT|nr:NYN domain-containing protein [Aureliella helgolandensis]QDV22206.1 NYN domain protein [Aureliella helgolandensis]